MNRRRLGAIALVLVAAIVLWALLRGRGRALDDDSAAAAAAGSAAPRTLAADPHAARPQAAPGSQAAVSPSETSPPTAATDAHWRLRLTISSRVPVPANSDLRGVPIVGATARVYVVSGTRIDLGRFRTDENGVIDVALTPLGGLSKVARAAATIQWWEVRAPGHVANWSIGHVTGSELVGDPHTIEREECLERGASIRGRVVDERGRPVTGATASLVPPTGVDITSETDAEGVYVLAAASAGRGFVYAAADPASTSAARDVEWSGDRDVDLPDLVVRPGVGTIAGTVVGLDGKPLAGVPVVMHARGLAVEDRPDDVPGFLHKRVIADDAGKFRATGLRTGRYTLWAVEEWADVEAAEFATGVEDARVVLRDHLLVVHVVDEAGREVPGAVVQVWSLPSDPVDLSENAVKTWFVVPPSSRARVRTEVLGFDAAEKTIDVGPGSGPTAVTLTLRPQGPPGRVRVRLVGDAAAVSGVCFEGFPSGEASSWSPGDGPFAMATGSHDVHAIVVPRGGDSLESNPFVEKGLHVDVPSGEETEVAIPIVRGGLVSTHVELPDGLVDPTLLLVEARPASGGDRFRTRWVVRRPDGSDDYATDGRSLRLLENVPIRTPVALPPGLLQFTFHVSDCKPVEALILVEAGKTSAVTIRPPKK